MASTETIEGLRRRGVTIPAAETLEIGEEVRVERIHGPNTVLHAGTRLRGRDLLISPGCRIGAEGPATVDNCVLGQEVQLKGGYFSEAVFLHKSSMGLGAHVRAGTLMEEQANGAHTVGLKQTVLLPFVTLGSLINFCDILMAGGTSRNNHSEVGSSFIHFNFTPFGARGDKATPSLIGDVPQGVMLRSPRIFLGGQAGLVGPVHIDYGTVLAAGFVYRRDYGRDLLVIGEKTQPVARPFAAPRYTRIGVRVQKNLTYIGNLVALWAWYEHVRRPFAAADDVLLAQVYRAAQAVVVANIVERTKQLARLAGYMDDSIAGFGPNASQSSPEITTQKRFRDEWPEIERRLAAYPELAMTQKSHMEPLTREIGETAAPHYLATVQRLSDDAVGFGQRWLDSIVHRVVSLFAWPPKS